MTFVGLDPIRMRELASIAQTLSGSATELAEQTSTLISSNALQDVAGATVSLFDEVGAGMTQLSRLAQYKATEMEFAASGGGVSYFPDMEDLDGFDLSDFIDLLMAYHAVRNDPEALKALNSLRDSEGYRNATDEQKHALLSQVANYPNAKSIHNLERFASKEWAQDFSIADYQRSAKMIAYLSQYPDGDQATIDNTLDSFLADDAPYRFDWNKGGDGYGSAGGNVFHLNRMYLAAGDGGVESSTPPGIDRSDTFHMVRNTVAHEVNHLRNGDKVSKSYDYFMGEYRAFYVGFVAEHGRPPTRDEMRGWVALMLSATSSLYPNIADALKDPTEGPKIAKFVSQMLGKDVPPDRVVAELNALKDGLDQNAPEPVSVDGGPNNLDNSP